MKNILGLDLGTNSIGWALIDNETKVIIKAGSRIIPMDAATLGDYDKGNLKSGASVRTDFRSMRRLYERAILRRERLLRVLNVMGFLPESFSSEIDFEDHPGKFRNDNEPKIAWRKSMDGKNVFIFMDSFNEMLNDFRNKQPELVANGKKVPYDWTIYYLRKKALTSKISKEELAWILLNFNTKRGYYQLRSEIEEEKETNKLVEYKLLRVANVEKLEEDKRRKGFFWYEIVYENGSAQRKLSVASPRSIGDTVELIVTTELEDDGVVKKDKDGAPKIKLRDPKEDDWTLMKKRTEHEINASGQTVGAYIYDCLLRNPDVKVRGKLIHTIERAYYKDELKRILDKQCEFHSELRDNSLYKACVRELYHNNEAHVLSLKDKNFTSFFLDDIIFYQRPLKSKKSLIANCPYETYHYKDENGQVVERAIKCIPKSNPLYQEFRLWQFVDNLRIYKREEMVNGKLRVNHDVTTSFLKTADDYAALFDWLNQKKEIKQDELLKYKPFGIGNEYKAYRWNYVEDRIYPCNETRYEICKRMKKVDAERSLNEQELYKLWHIAYSVDDPIENVKALTTFAQKLQFDPNDFVAQFKNYSIAKKDYGAYSEKAIKKLLPLMRMGYHWREEDIHPETKERIEKIINGEVDERISMRVREKAMTLRNVSDFSGLPLWFACYVVYDRHSEAEDLTRWEKPEDIDTWLNVKFKQHSLRNPVVEAVLGETLRVVRDIWKSFGKIDEVHIEMGRNLKQDAKSRLADLKRQQENERTNLRIRTLLQELANPDSDVENVRPHSPSQIEILKIFEQEVLNNHEDEMEDELKNIIGNMGNNAKSSHVSHSDVMKYRLWLEQRYQSPYTGRTIPLSKLFTTAYQIEHVIPQSRYFDDSLSNKVICESEVNKEKDRMLGYEFIVKKGGSIIKGAMGQDIRIFTKDEYEDFVKNHYKSQKMKKLLMDDIPQEFVQRQINDTRYMTRKIASVLSMLVREEGEQEAVSKHIVMTNGAITDRLKKEWGINDVWNNIIAPRFIRLNEKTESNRFGEWKNNDGKRYFQINIPLELSAHFSKKRIDHRHHAMDAMVIACTTRDMVNYLNNSNALESRKQQRYDLQHKLCTKIKTDDRGNYVWRFNQPWERFPADVRNQLESIIVSFKQNLRVINKTTNYYQHYVNGKKIYSKQTKGDGWSIRKSLHKATVSGRVTLQKTKSVKLSEALKVPTAIRDKALRQEIKRIQALYSGNCDVKTLNKYFKDRDYKFNDKDISKVDVYYYTDGKEALSATRVAVDDSFDEKKIASITDTGIQKIMLRHLHQYDDEKGKSHPEIAFTPEGIDTMNKNIVTLNDGKNHKSILKVRKTETLGMKFPVGERGAKKKKYVEADQGTNMFFAIYEDENGNRSFESVPFNLAVERAKNGLPMAEQIKENGDKLLFTLSPGDLVRLPEDSFDGSERDYFFKFVSCTGNRGYFIPSSWASVIYDKVELESLNKVEAFRGVSIKSKCQKIKVDRLGNIV